MFDCVSVFSIISMIGILIINRINFIGGKVFGVFVFEKVGGLGLMWWVMC